MKSDQRETLASVVKAGPRQRPGRSLYVLVAFLFWTALYVYLPTLPTYVRSRSASLTLVGVILAQYGLWQAIIRFPIGIAADWLGRRGPFISAGIALAGAGAWLMGAAESPTGLLAGRALTGLAAGAWVPLVVAFSGLYPARQAIRAVAMLSFVASVGRLLATSATGWLNRVGGYTLPFKLAIGASALALMLWLSVPERVRAPMRPSITGLGRLITQRSVLLPSLLAASYQYANWGITFSFLPVLAEQMGASGITLSALMSMHIGLVMLMALVAGALAERVGPARLVRAVFMLIATGVGVAAISPSLALVFAAQFCLGVAQGLAYPVLMGLSIREVDSAERTTAMGLHQAVYAVGMFTGPWLSGLVADLLGIRTMFGMTAFACLTVGLVITRLLSTARTGIERW